MFKALIVFVGGVLVSQVQASNSVWDNLSAAPVGMTCRVSPGQMVYTEVRMDKIPMYTLSQRVKSKMKGGMGLKFWFSLEPGELRMLESDSDWTYFGVRKGRAAAWHSIAGDVLAGKDHVGVRKSRFGSDLEWYVDNSFHNGQVTIWTRKIDADELKWLAVATVEEANGNPVRELTYLGKRQGELQFRLKELTPTGQSSDVFAYEVLPGEDTVVSILGAEIRVSEISNTGATLTMLKPFNEIVSLKVSTE